MRRRASPACAIGLLLFVFAACRPEPGHFEVRLTWGRHGPVTAPQATIFAEVRQANLNASGRPNIADALLLDEAPPASVRSVLEGDGRLDFDSVPHDEPAIVVVEIYEQPSRGSRRLRYAVSEPFTLVPGARIEVDVLLDFERPPNSTAINRVIVVNGRPPSEDVIVAEPVVLVSLTTDTATRAIVSNFDSFPSDASREIPKADFQAFEWDLNEGLEDDCGLDPARGRARRDVCRRRIHVRMHDAFGVTSAVLSRDVLLDTKPPHVVQSSTRYEPGRGNPIPQVGAANDGTTVSVTVVASELVETDPRFDALGPDGATLTLRRVPSEVTAVGATYQAHVEAGQPDGVYRATLGLADLAGNDAEEELDAEIVVLTSRPVLTVDQNRISFVRSPVGIGVDEPLGSFTRPAGAFFGLGPRAPFSGDSTLGPRTFLLEDSSPPIAIRVWADEQRMILVSDTIRPRNDGHWSREDLQLANFDTPSVYVSGIDLAGNESAPVRIERAYYVATSGPTAATGHAAHLTTTSANVSAPLVDRAPTLATPLAAPNGQTVTARATHRWRRFFSGSPGPRRDHSMAYDSAFGRTVLFGGFTDDDTTWSDMWTWDGASWRFVETLFDPPPGSPMVAYDARRGRTVVFVGSDIWELEGTTWRRLELPNQQSFAGVLAYDSARAETIYIGANEVLTWDGETLVDRTSTAAPNGVGAVAAFDVAHGHVVLLEAAGAAGTWTWDGAWMWTPSAPPVVGVDRAMVYDAEREQIVLTGNDDTGSFVTSTWDGASWADRSTPIRPPSRTGHAMSYDTLRSRVVLFGGRNEHGDTLRDTWEWDGTGWTEQATGPSARSGVGLAYDETQDEIVMFGGTTPWSATSSETWTRHGTSWRRRWTITTPPARTGGSMAPGLSDGVLLFGGVGGGHELWRWHDNEWSELPGASGPSGRSGHRMVRHVSSNEVLLVGGFDRFAHLRQTWAWGVGGWVERESTPNPRTYAAAAYDAIDEITVLHSGGIGASRGELRSDTLVWDGGEWTSRNAPRALGARQNAVMAYDVLGRRLVLFGGSGRRDTWAFQDPHWTRIETTGEVPSTSSGHAMVYDDMRQRIVLVDGDVTSSSRMSTWELEPPADAAIQFAVQLPADLRTRAVRLPSILVRAWCGAAVGETTLHGWSTGGPSNRPGVWRPLVSTTGTGASVVDYFGREDDVRSMLGPDGRMFVECRAPIVEADYFEAWIAYEPN